MTLYHEFIRRGAVWTKACCETMKAHHRHNIDMYISRDGSMLGCDGDQFYKCSIFEIAEEEYKKIRIKAAKIITNNKIFNNYITKPRGIIDRLWNPHNFFPEMEYVT